MFIRHSSYAIDKITSDSEQLCCVYILHHNYYYKGKWKSHAVNIDGTATTVEDFKEANLNICNRQLLFMLLSYMQASL